MKTIVVGLGNPILGDDGVGWRAAEMLRTRLEAAEAEIDTLAAGGIGLMERMVDFDRAIIIDAFSTGSQPAGSVSCIPLEAIENTFAGHLGSAHESNLQTALEVGRALGARLPGSVTVVAIEAQRVYDFSNELSQPVADALPEAVQAVIDLLSKKEEPDD